ncbi:MAG: hypothetical protein AB7I57_15250, partial [Pirellulales bacterium]
DLRESVLRRAERSMLVAKDATAAGRPGADGFSLPFGRSKRAWFWSAMALAAALLVMFVERDVQRNAGLPKEVALKPPAVKRPDGPLPPLAMRAIESKEEALPPQGDDLATDNLRRGEATRSDESRVDAFATAEPDMARQAAPKAEVASRAAGSVAGGGIAGGGGAVGRAPVVEGIAGSEVVVVHVSVTPEAMQNRAFDATLLKNQIEVKSESEALSDQGAEPQDVEVVVVEAAPAQVYSTLAEIKRDTKNYLGIAVEPQPSALGANFALQKQKDLNDIQQYNRGRVANQQQVKFEPDHRNFYFVTPKQELDNRGRQLLERQPQVQEQYSATSSGVPAEGEPSTATPQQSLALDAAAKAPLPATAQTPPAQSTASETQLPARRQDFDRAKQSVARQAKQKLAKTTDMLQVLFVLQADAAPAPTEPPAAIPTSSAPAGEGLKGDE